MMCMLLLDVPCDFTSEELKKGLPPGVARVPPGQGRVARRVYKSGWAHEILSDAKRNGSGVQDQGGAEVVDRPQEFPAQGRAHRLLLARTQAASSRDVALMALRDNSARSVKTSTAH